MRQATKCVWMSVVAVAALCWATQSAQADTFATGDMVVVTSPGTQLMVGTKAVAPLAVGTQLKVAETKGPWVATWIIHDGKMVGGWVWNPLVQHEQARRFSVDSVNSTRFEPYYDRQN